MRAAVVGLALLVAAPATAQDRLPREVLDVIPPSERVTGGRGDMRIVQRACRVGPTHWARRRIVEIAAQEWAVFGFQTFDARPTETRMLPEGVVADSVNPTLPAPRQARHGVRFGAWESEARMDASVAGYWSSTPDGEEIVRRQNRAWRDGDGETFWVEPWSAAFVSWVMCEAGLGEMGQFRRDIGHWRYIDQAIEARDGQAPDAAFVAYDPGERPIAPGDLLCNARAGTRYRTLADRRAEQGRRAASHCDIVVRVDAEARTAAVIGGNVVNGVSLTILPLTAGPDGVLRPVGPDDLEGARSIFAHLSLRADPVEDLALDGTQAIRALTSR
ncbi:DUF2272 domain-containing protein [Brevundimonas sp.]|uniref:DUF2272 domain-containing protein n=1 Tax=Brevundimonas sp. TaxID=1871086 RepID=UPI0025CDDB94|nr:DUF2272 domain-containing protein [Brevundimonas sp.]